MIRMKNAIDYSVRARLRAAADRKKEDANNDTRDKSPARVSSQPRIQAAGPQAGDLPGFARISEAYRAKVDSSRLKTKLEVEIAAIKDRATRFQEANFGRVTNSGAGSQLDGLRGLAGARSRNPVDQQGLNMVTGRNGMLSENPAEGKGKENETKERSWKDAVSNFFSAAFGTIVGKLEFPAFPAWGFLTAPGSTGTDDGPQNIGEGAKAFGRMRNGQYYHPGMKDVDTEEPVPDDLANSAPVVITRGDIKGIMARRNAAVEPVDDQAGSGGPVNTGANGTGRTASLAQPVNDFTASAAVTRFDPKGLEARIQSRILTTR